MTLNAIVDESDEARCNDDADGIVRGCVGTYL